MLAPTPPPRRQRFGLGTGCMRQQASVIDSSGHHQHGQHEHHRRFTIGSREHQLSLHHRTRSFSRIASGLKLAQAQAMAVAGFLPDWQPQPQITDANDNSSAGMHAPCSIINHRASFHGRGQPLYTLFLLLITNYTLAHMCPTTHTHPHTHTLIHT